MTKPPPPEPRGEIGDAGYRAIAAVAPDAIVTARDDGTIVAWNPAATTMFGYEADEAIGLPVLVLVAQTSAGGHEGGLASLRNSGGLRRAGAVFEASGRRRDGTDIPIELSIAEWRTPEGHFATAIIRDITERVAADRLLRTSEEQYRSVVDALAEGITLQGADSSIYAVNAAAETILGLTADQMSGRTSLDPRWRSIHEDGTPFPGETHPSIVTLTTGEPQTGVVMGVHKPDDTLTWISINSRPLVRPGEANPNAVVTSFTDITATRAAQRALSEVESRFVAAFGAVPDALAIVAAVRDEAGAIRDFAFVWVNEAFRARFTPNEADVTGRGLYELVPTTLVRRPLHVRVTEERVPERVRVQVGDRWFDNLMSPYEDGLAYVSRDITDRVEAERLLRESEAHYRALVDGVPGIIYSFSNLHGGLFYSPRAADILGYSPEQLLADPMLWNRSIHPDDRPLIDASVAASAAEEPFVVEYRIRDARGDWRWFEDRLLASASTGGEVVIEGLALDITERKRAEAELHESKERYRTLFESASDAVFVVDVATTRILDANIAASALSGYSHAELLTMTNTDLSPDPEETSRRAREAQESPGQVLAIPARLLRGKDGTVFTVDISARSVEWRDQRVLLVACRDITERKRAEEALRRSEAALRDAQRVAHVGSWTWHVKQNRLEWSPEMYRIFGIDQATFSGALDEVVSRSIHPDDRAAVDAANRSVAEDGRPVPLEYRVIHPDGSVRVVWAEAGALVLDDAGDPEVLTGIVEDITERRQAEAARASLEAQLAQAQKMESVGRLAGGVAHDFNNMLAAILGNTELALEELDPASPATSNLLEIREAARRSADLTRQLLAFARRQTIAPRVLDLDEAVGGMLDMLRRLILAGVELAWKPGGDLWAVRMDLSQLDQVLTNLVVNAGDAVGDIGMVTIETGNATLDADACATRPGALPGEYVVLTVSDDGHGMDQDTMSHLFEPFFTTKESGKGTGLGLATVHGIVTQNDGFIDVYSEPGTGSTFRVYLPRHRGPATAPEALTRDAAGGGGETVLLVEDEPAILRLATVMLERLGYRVVAAATPGEAIRLAREHSGEVHLLMTDVVMPEMTGRDLARNLLSLYPRIGRLYMSGYTADVIADHGVLDEGVHFLQKPFSEQDLAAKVREALDHDPVSSDASAR